METFTLSPRKDSEQLTTEILLVLETGYYFTTTSNKRFFFEKM